MTSSRFHLIVKGPFIPDAPTCWQRETPPRTSPNVLVVDVFFDALSMNGADGGIGAKRFGNSLAAARMSSEGDSAP